VGIARERACAFTAGYFCRCMYIAAFNFGARATPAERPGNHRNHGSQRPLPCKATSLPLTINSWESVIPVTLVPVRGFDAMKRAEIICLAGEGALRPMTFASLVSNLGRYHPIRCNRISTRSDARLRGEAKANLARRSPILD
jgi:hypothetical protein